MKISGWLDNASADAVKRLSQMFNFNGTKRDSVTFFGFAIVLFRRLSGASNTAESKLRCACDTVEVKQWHSSGATCFQNCSGSGAGSEKKCYIYLQAMLGYVQWRTKWSASHKQLYIYSLSRAGSVCWVETPRCLRHHWVETPPCLRHRWVMTPWCLRHCWVILHFHSTKKLFIQA